MNTATPLVAIRDLDVRFRSRRATVHAVNGVTLDIHSGEMLGLVGESGSGKTTLGRAILGLVQPTGGSVRFDGEELLGASAARRRELGTAMQVVFQNPYASLNPARTVGDAVGEPLRVHQGLRGADLQEAVDRLFRRVGLAPESATRFPHAFSGGQRQRIAIARAIALGPRFVVYDEAVSALDVSTRGQVINLLAALQRDLGITGLFIGHDLAVVRHVSDRIAVMFRGHLVEIGPAAAVADHPLHPYTQRLVESVLIADPAIQRTRRANRRRADPMPVSSQGAGCPFVHECPARLDQCATAAPLLAPVSGEPDAPWVACHLVATAARSR